MTSVHIPVTCRPFGGDVLDEEVRRYIAASTIPRPCQRSSIAGTPIAPAHSWASLQVMPLAGSPRLSPLCSTLARATGLRADAQLCRQESRRVTPGTLVQNRQW
jgi:hypothetical protein